MDYESARQIKNAAFLLSQVACAQVMCASMVAENQVRASKGEAPAYGEGEFQALIDQHGIGHNSALNTLHM